MARGRPVGPRHARDLLVHLPSVPHNITNVSKQPARVLMTVSPPGHEHHFEELAKLAARGGPPDAKAIGELRGRFDTDQLSVLTTRT